MLFWATIASTLSPFPTYSNVVQLLTMPPMIGTGTAAALMIVPVAASIIELALDYLRLSKQGLK
jgi:hypothetical protein